MLRRFSVFFLALLLCFSLFPARAFASYFSDSASVLWSGSVNGGAQYGAFVKGGTNYDAAVAALGYDSSRLSDEVKTRLADESHSSYFYTFATSFQRVSTPFDIPSWVPVFVTTGSVIADLWNNISGSSYPHWSVEVVSVLYDLALRDFKAVLAGEDLGGGGSSGTGVYHSISIRAFANTGTRYMQSLAATNASYVDGEIVPSGGNTTISAYTHHSHYVPTGTLYLSDSFISVSNDFVSNGYDVVWAIDRNGIYLIYGHGLSIAFRQATSDDNGYYVFGSDGMLVFYRSTVYYDGQQVFSLSPRDAVASSTSRFNLPATAMWLSDVNPVFSSPVPPPGGEWPEPETPAAPVAPELPEPAEPVEVPEPVVVAPTVTWPDITINIEPDPVPGTTPEGLDYTELLTRINDNLISIDAFARAINSNLNSLRGDLLAEFNGVIDSLRNIYNYLLTIDSVLETHCVHLRNKMEESAVFIANYMRTLIKWLADQLDYDDMTNVEAPDNSLLTTINEKLGGGTYEPNPIKDEQGYYEWLDDLWDRFLLGDNWQSSMGSISGSFSELKTRFPFSVPWDIVALFRLFVHDPVTPVFDLPLYFSADGSTPVHVDLSPWDSVASLVRPMIFVIFALKLALLSRDLLGGLGADKGGL